LLATSYAIQEFLGMSLAQRCPLKIPAKLTDHMSFKFVNVLPEDFPSQFTTPHEEYVEVFCNTPISQISPEFENENVFVAPTARRLHFDKDSEDSVCLSMPATTKTIRTKGKKRETPAVETEVRRSTRFQVKNNGYKLEPMRDQPTPKKKPRCKPFSDEAVTPHTPIPVLQHIGMALEIPDEELTVDKLVAGPQKTKPSSVSNDD
jgi:hypothetical protein